MSGYYNNSKNPSWKVYSKGIEITSYVKSFRNIRREGGIDELTTILAISKEATHILSLETGDDVVIFASKNETGLECIHNGIIENRSYGINSTDGEIISLYSKCKFASSLQNMRVFDEYGSESTKNYIKSPNGKCNLNAIVKDVIHTYVNSVGGGALTGYSFNEDLILGTDEEFDIPFIEFNYPTAMDALHDICKLLTSLRFVDNIKNNGKRKGVHWITLPTGHLCIADIGAHWNYNAQIENLWNTYALGGQVLTINFLTKTASIIEDIPKANICFISGKYQSPKIIDSFTEGTANLWKAYRITKINNLNVGGMNYLGVYGIRHDESAFQSVSNSTNGVSQGNYSLALKRNGTVIGAPTNIEQHTFMMMPLPDDVISLIQSKNKMSIGFTVEAQNGIDYVDVLLMADEGHYYSYRVNIDESDEIQYVDVSLDKENYIRGDKIWKETSKSMVYVNNAGTPYMDTFIPYIPRVNWYKIKYIGFAFRVNTTNTFTDRELYIDNLMFHGYVTRMMADSNIWIGDTGTKNPNYKYPVKLSIEPDTLSPAYSLSRDDLDSPLTLNLINTLTMNSCKLFTSTFTIPFEPSLLAGQFIRIRSNGYCPFKYDIGQTYKTFRIISVTHDINNSGASTIIEVTDDLFNALSRSEDMYSQVIRAVSPDKQNRMLKAIFNSTPIDKFNYVIASKHDMSFVTNP